MTAHPTAAELRAAANHALVARCEDPLLASIMALARQAASQGDKSCRIDFPLGVEDGRREAIGVALEALGLNPHWSFGDPSSLSISWQ
jgi:hypothetical protein